MMNKDVAALDKVEVKSTMWQKVAAFCLCVILLGIGLSGLFPILLPTLFYNQSVQQANTIKICLMLTLFTVLCLLGVYTWWSTLNYVLCADANSIMQSDGFRTIRVCWPEVSSYKWRRRVGTSDTYIEPVLFDRNGNIIFKPFAHIITSDRFVMQSRVEFWRYAIGKIDGSA